MTHKKVMEAALFISNSPMTLDQLARVSSINSLGHVKELMESLQKDYEGRGLELANTVEGWVMQVRQELLPRVAHLTPYSDLGEGPKRTLALVTLKEPVKQSVIIRMQGNKAYSYIKELVKRGLVVAERVGHTKILKLTQEFERYFGDEKARIKEQLQRHLEATGKLEEAVRDKVESQKEECREFLDDTPRGTRRPEKEKARASVIKGEAAQEIPKLEEDEEEPEVEEKKKGRVKASHGHAFKEIE